MDTKQIDKYIKSIRNRVKKDYAVAYYDYLVGNRQQEPTDDRYPISYMAKQAVRLQLSQILRSN